VYPARLREQATAMPNAPTPMGGVVSQAPEVARAAIERDIVEGCQPFVDGDAMLYEQPIVWATPQA
jgi:hypothetical protein